MKLAQKMMLIPAGRTPIEYSNLSELDQAMTNVINNKNRLLRKLIYIVSFYKKI